MAHRGLTLLCATVALCAPNLAWADEPVARIDGELTPQLRDIIDLNLERVEAPSRSRAQARRRIERTATALRSILNSQGYYDPDFEASIEEAKPKADPGKTPPLIPVILVTTGPRYTIGDASVSFTDGEIAESDEARAELQLPTGDPAVAAKVVAAGLRVTNWLEQHGYPEAKIANRNITLDHGTDTLSVTYPVSHGPKVRFGPVKLEGDAKLMSSWVEMIEPFERGEIFDERKLDELTSRVVSTGVFEQAVATLDDDDMENADGTLTRGVILNIDQGDKNTVSGSVGYSTTEGSGVEVIYERRNFVGYAQTLTLRGVARTNEIGLGVSYDIPYFLRTDRSLAMDLEAVREDTDAFKGERATARALISQQVSDRFRIGLGVGVEASRFEQNNIEREAYIADVIGNGIYDARNNRLDPTKGFLLSGEVVPAYNFGKGKAFFTRAEIGGSAYRRVSDEFVLAGKLEAGTIIGTGLENIPFNRRFYAGGGGSVRGFGYQSIGPRDVFDEPTGGRSLIAGSGEVRWRSQKLLNGNIGAAAFLDAGTVTPSEFSNFEDIRYGAGIGVRYWTAFAPLRADIAIPLNPRDGDNAFQIYISIGQAF